MIDVAIVGAGPRGIAALQSLASKVTGNVTVHLFGALNENGENVAGQGTPFHVGQPTYSRLNARSAVVDHFAPYRPEPIPIDEANPSDDVQALRGEGDSADDRAIVGADFDTWAQSNGREEWVNNFPPRAIIGDYLDYCATYVKTNLPPHITLVEYGRATTIDRDDSQWRVEAGDVSILADELLLTVGHAHEPPNKLTLDDVEDFARVLIDSPYPLAQLDRVDPGARVATRGAGLSFIDIALALTEGKGGTFSVDGSTYTPSGNEPSIIYPTGLEGVFLDAKPDIDELQEMLTEARWNTGRQRIATAVSLDDVVAEVRELASEILAGLGFSAPKTAFDEVIAGPTPTPGMARARLEESLGETYPARTVVAATAITVFEQLLDYVANKEFSRGEWNRFSKVLSLVTSYGFGPPAINARKLLALIDSGIVSTEWLDGGVDALDLPEKVDVMVESMLAPPGYWPGAYPGLENLDDMLSVWADPTVDGKRTGVRTDINGSVVDETNTPVPGLAAIGRMTEDWVISTDSLNRSAHPYIEKWAQRIAERVS